jgi:hypothetical protein
VARERAKGKDEWEWKGEWEGSAQWEGYSKWEGDSSGGLRNNMREGEPGKSGQWAERETA